MNITFIPSDSRVLFGRVDTNDGNYILLVPGDEKANMLMIEEDFFLLLDLALKIELGEYSIYYDYSLSPAQWQNVLFICDKIVNANSFDDIFDYTTDADYNTNMLGNSEILYFINNNGKALWDNVETYKTILSDIKKWTDLFCQNVKINIWGL